MSMSLLLRISFSLFLGSAVLHLGSLALCCWSITVIYMYVSPSMQIHNAAVIHNTAVFNKPKKDTNEKHKCKFSYMAFCIEMFCKPSISPRSMHWWRHVSSSGILGPVWVSFFVAILWNKTREWWPVSQLSMHRQSHLPLSSEIYLLIVHSWQPASVRTRLLPSAGIFGQNENNMLLAWEAKYPFWDSKMLVRTQWTNLTYKWCSEFTDIWLTGEQNTGQLGAVCCMAHLQSEISSRTAPMVCTVCVHKKMCECFPELVRNEVWSGGSTEQCSSTLFSTVWAEKLDLESTLQRMEHMQWHQCGQCECVQEKVALFPFSARVLIWEGSDKQECNVQCRLMLFDFFMN